MRANLKVSILEKIKRADGTWVSVTVKVPKPKPNGKGFYLKDCREGKFYLFIAPTRVPAVEQDFRLVPSRQRQIIVWQKTNPYPESVKDRLTSSTEDIIVLTKQGKYYWNYSAAQEKAIGSAGKTRRMGSSKRDNGRHDLGNVSTDNGYRNSRKMSGRWALALMTALRVSTSQPSPWTFHGGASGWLPARET